MTTKKDTKIELFFNDELIISSTARELIESGAFEAQDTNKGTPTEDDIALNIGDRIPLVDFPTKGNTINIRIMRKKQSFDDDTNNLKRIQYFAEEYKG